LTRLANKGHAESMRGAAGGVVAAAERLLKRAPERAAAADGSAKGARAVRRAALRCVGAIVSSASESGNAGNDTRRPETRPLRPETRVAAAKLLLAAVKFDAPSREFLNGASNLSAKQKNAQKLADAGAVAAACVALGKLATSPGGFDVWTDPAETPHGGPSASVGDAVASTLFSLLDHDDDDAAAAAAAAASAG
jgi:poly-gamma-glutamate capsule biosynthesis protein CapA/YwtB (metallophosphatase superfamily)